MFICSVVSRIMSRVSFRALRYQGSGFSGKHSMRKIVSSGVGLFGGFVWWLIMLFSARVRRVRFLWCGLLLPLLLARLRVCLG